jgi:hypothetical protein
MPEVRAKIEDRFRVSQEILKELFSGKVNIPEGLLNRSKCVIIIPRVKKLAFGFGASYGRGNMMCRLGGENYNGRWSAPSMCALEGGNIGLQIGAQGIDLVLLVMNAPTLRCGNQRPRPGNGDVLAGKIDRRDASAYVVAQIVEAIIAAGVILVIANGAPGGYSPATSGLGADGYGEHSPAEYSLFSALLTEVVLTMFLVLNVLGSTDSQALVGFAGLAIGLALTLIHLVSRPITKLILGEPCAEYRSHRVCGRMGSHAIVDVHTRACIRCRACGGRLSFDSANDGSDLDAGSGEIAGDRTTTAREIAENRVMDAASLQRSSLCKRQRQSEGSG